MSKKTIFLSAVCAFMMMFQMTNAQTVYHSDDFTVDSSADYTEVAQSDHASDAPDFATDYNSDHSSYNNNNGNAIPPAPNTTDSSTFALRTEVNVSQGAGNILTIWPNISDISGDHRLQFDAYFAISTSGGSTEQAGGGILGDGTDSLPTDFLEGAGGGPNPIDEDTSGYYFHSAGDQGWASRDFAFYKGDPAIGGETGIPTQDADFFFFGPVADGDNTQDAGGSSLFTDTIFPSPPFAVAGDWQDAWVTWEIKVVQGVVTVSANGNRICQYNDPGDTFTSGRPAILHEDAFNSLGNGFVLFDNILVEEILPPLAADETWSLYE